MECFPAACRDKEAGRAPAHILLLTFVTRDGVRAAQSQASANPRSPTPLRGARSFPRALVPSSVRVAFSALMLCRDRGLLEKHIQRCVAGSCDGCLTL